MDVAQAVLLGILQGVTEWLPISSSGHLALAQMFLDIDATVPFDIMLHLGTLLAVVAFYRRDLIAMARGILARDSKSLRLAGLIILCAIPTAVIGLAFKGVFEGFFSSPPAVASMLAITGIFLIVSSGAKPGEGRPDARSAILIGIAQGIAVAPGISRSGSTIGTALLLGIGREEAARFSFLAAIIPILGAAALEGRHILDSGFEPVPLIAGFLAAAVAGYLSIGILLRILRGGRFEWFGYYCLAVSAITLAASFAA